MNCMFCRAEIEHAWHDSGQANEAHAFEQAPQQIRSGDNELRDRGYSLGPSADQPKARRGDPRFLALLDDIEKLHATKQADYGRDQDPFANVRASEEWGVPAWVGAMVRATDKVRRLQTYAVKGSLENEGLEDSLMDLAVYSLISLILFREEQGG